MAYTLAPHISFGFVGADAVVLDIAADRYLRLGKAETDTLRALTEGEWSDNTPAAFERLSRRGIIVSGSGPIAPVVAAPVIASVVETISFSRATCEPGVLEILTARMMAARWMDFAGLSRTMARWRALRTRAGPFDPAEPSSLADLVRAFQQGMRYYPSKRRCVQDSLALMTCLWRRHFDADVYFGVRLDPFAAHCWVQSGGLLLTDPAAVVAEFSPVFRL
ncbi:lasso peptide biosynthesis B2 protein [Sphingopyxis sp. PAMC25046]|uniref:lasso peptide biosynthesis B2 protein n=1 Tax=Sphingopyxis sp. PAMC25046 TaxID=2565556 RepID=UPI00109E0B4F|nr:lasso peptide biosynthesis B2 protein [Sphingopyxis sp. PAMC25046]QCB55845.1 lasso peptide biosynthesis B2 protein [Sphingopyxis sp. PAMC25046]